MRKLRTVVAMTVLISVAALGSASADPFTASVGRSNITIAGVTPGAQVLVFGLGIEPVNGHAIGHRTVTVVSDSDNDGTVVYPFDRPIDWNAIWIAVDLRSGRYAITPTPGFPVIREHMTHREFRRNSDASIARFAYARPAMELLYIRPGGAWIYESRDGNATDSDKALDGMSEALLSNFQPVVGTEAARQFEPGGTLLVIDPTRLDLLELRLDAALLAGAR
jgi:hypothetical protein